MNKINIGDIKNVGGFDFIVLDVDKDKVICISKEFVFTSKFGNNTNNFAKSTVINKLNGEFLENLEKSIDADNVLNQEIDLTALNGSTEYGSVKCKVGLITQPQYVKYRDLIKPYIVSDWWWTATPMGTKNDGQNEYFVCCLLPNGDVCDYYCDFNCGVRAFCTLKSSIFDS